MQTVPIKLRNALAAYAILCSVVCAKPFNSNAAPSVHKLPSYRQIEIVLEPINEMNTAEPASTLWPWNKPWNKLRPEKISETTRNKLQIKQDSNLGKIITESMIHNIPEMATKASNVVDGKDEPKDKEIKPAFSRGWVKSLLTKKKIAALVPIIASAIYIGFRAGNEKDKDHPSTNEVNSAADESENPIIMEPVISRPIQPVPVVHVTPPPTNLSSPE